MALADVKWLLVYLRKNRYQPGGARCRAHFVTVVVHEVQVEKGQFDIRNITMTEPAGLNQATSGASNWLPFMQ